MESIFSVKLNNWQLTFSEKKCGITCDPVTLPNFVTLLLFTVALDKHKLEDCVHKAKNAIQASVNNIMDALLFFNTIIVIDHDFKFNVKTSMFYAKTSIFYLNKKKKSNKSQAKRFKIEWQ